MKHLHFGDINVAQIIYIEGEGSYSRLYLQDGTNHLFAKTLKQIAGFHPGLIRVHKRYLVNFDHVLFYTTSQTDYYNLRVYLNLSNGIVVSAGRTVRDEILRLLTEKGIEEKPSENGSTRKSRNIKSTPRAERMRRSRELAALRPIPDSLLKKYNK